MAIYAVDFDGTLANTRFPEIISPREKAIAAIKILKAQGHKIILWTSRTGKPLDDAVSWCRQQGLYFDAINKPIIEQIEKWGDDTRKIYADYYIDDKAITIDALETMTERIFGIMKEFEKTKQSTGNRN